MRTLYFSNFLYPFFFQLYLLKIDSYTAEHSTFDSKRYILKNALERRKPICIDYDIRFSDSSIFHINKIIQMLYKRFLYLAVCFLTYAKTV